MYELGTKEELQELIYNLDKNPCAPILAVGNIAQGHNDKNGDAAMEGIIGGIMPALALFTD